MTDSWPLRTIADCASPEPYATQIGPFGKALTPEEYTPSGVPLLRGVNVNQGRFHDDDFVFISEETADRMWKYESFPGDVLFVHKGTLGKIGLMPKSRRFDRYIMGNSMLRVRCDHSKLLPEYLYYWLCSADGQHYILSRVSQVGVPQIQRPLTTLREATLPVPPVGYQKAVVDILGTLDDKIELNRRMNETLEGMARAIFKSWFVDFDPVRAKADGRDPVGMDPATASLFPDSFEDSPLGKIPKGWRVGTVGDLVIKVAMGPFGSSIKTDNFVDAGVPVVRGGNLTSGFIDDSFVFLREEKADELKNANAFSGDLVITHRGTLGQVGLIPKKARFPRYVVSQSQMLVRPDVTKAPSHFLFLFLTSPSGQSELLANTSQTGVPAIARPTSSVKAIRLVAPVLAVLRRFELFAESIFAVKDDRVAQSRMLTNLRDSLLPRLLSGELRVPEAERMVEAAT